ncbi:MAG: NAD(P)-dependent oxidoreductase [Chloroflexi bacterium]|nr:NAD(P)-dependent oxidoreductase [Chloroflexota bacterium]
MKILVTGANGRIGSTLVKYLQQNGHWVRGLDVSEPPSGAMPDDMVTGSLLDLGALDRALDGVDAVAHLAALMTWHAKDNQRLFETNVTGTFQLLQAAKSRPLSRFVFASSGEVYPELNPRQLPITEDHPTLPNSPYGMSKFLGEQMVRNIGEQTGMPYTILRFSHTQAANELFNPNSFFSGPRFYVNAKIRQLESLPQSPAIAKTIETLKGVATASEQHYISLDLDGKPFRMGMCDVRDLCQGVELGLSHLNAVGETFNIGARQSFNFDEAVQYLAQATHLPVIEVKLHTTAYRYDTSITKAVERLGYQPQYTIFRMIDEIAAQRVR